MTELWLNLFGAPRLARDGQRVEIDTRKALALLAYLALNSQEHSREALAVLFWPEQNDKSARSSLRRALWTLRQALATEGLDGDKQTVIFHRPAQLVVDVLQFQSLISTAASVPDHQLGEQVEQLRAAVALYHADFLAGFTLPDCPAFDEWQFFTGETLRRTLADVLQRLMRWYTGGQDYTAAIEYARRWLALDPLHEPAHRMLMQLYAWSEQPAAALRQYEECTRLMEQELGVPPEEETSQLCVAIRNKCFPPPSDTTTRSRPASIVASPAAPVSAHHNLPARQTSLLGRDLDLAELDLLMFDRGERLITITGPGGIGKTVLALAAAERYWSAGRFRNGVFVVSLAAIDTVTAILPALMTALALQPAGGQVSEAALKRQVLNYLRARQMLLIFDNFEHLLEGGKLLVEILAAAPDVHILVTSRERLHLHDEQVYPIGGLACPTSVADGDAPALALFLRTARRIQPHFQPGHDVLVHLVRICQLVTGMPLALELAAGWVRLLPPSAIAEALQTNLDLLTTTIHDMPARHRSMRATFDTTWALLAEEERQIFAQLSVFRGGFTREAAEQVAGATLTQLSALADKALIEYRYPADRFEVHELLRQYGAEKLSTIGGREATSLRHLCYFLKLAETTEPHLRGAERAQWMRPLENEHNNLRLAFDWAYTQGMAEQTLRLAGMLTHYWIEHGAWVEGTHCIAAALTMHTPPAPNAASSADLRPLAKVLYAAGLLAWHQADYTRTKTYTDESLALYQQMADEFGCAQALHLLGLTARAQRDLAQATQYFASSLDLARKVPDKLLVALILQDMGAIAWRQNDFVKARELFEESLALYEDEQDTHGVGLGFHGLGLVAWWQGDLEHARAFGERSLVAFRQLADPFNTAEALTLLASVAIHQNDLDRAQSLIEQTIALCRTLGAQRVMATTMLKLGHVWCLQGNIAAAGQIYSEATALLRPIGDRLRLIFALEAWLYLAVCQNRFETAARLSGAVEALREQLGTPRPPVETKDYDRQIATVRASLSESMFKTAWMEGTELSLDQALDHALSTQ